MFGDLSGWVMDVILALGYVGLALLLIAENLFPPIPSEVILPLAGFLVGQGEMSFWGALVAATTGSLTGALVLYAMGRYGGRPLVLRYGAFLRVTHEDLDRAEGWFRRWGDWVVLGARVVPIARSVVSIPAGFMNMPLLRFVLLTTIGSALWNTLLIGAGYALGANWELVSDWVGRYSEAVLVIGAVSVAVFLLLWGLRRRKAGKTTKK